MTKISTLVVCFLFFWNTGIAQTTPNIVPPSPNAASIGKYGGYQPNLSSGLQNINIPLDVVTEGGLNVPISINYNYSGFKPSEETTVVGLGWSLAAGGLITRVIKGGIEDERYDNFSQLGGGYLLSGPKLQNTINPATGEIICNDGSNANCLYLDEVGTRWDGQPDMFNFSFGSYSGKFFFGADGKIKIVSDQALKIEYQKTTVTENGKKFSTNGKAPIFSMWTITTQDGTIYRFGFNSTGTTSVKAVDYALVSKGSAQEDIINTWHLSEIETQKGEKISFTYKNDYMTAKKITKIRNTYSAFESVGSTQSEAFSESQIKNEFSGGNFPGSRNTENALARIEGSNFVVKLNYIENVELSPFATTSYEQFNGWDKSTFKLLSDIKIYAKESSDEKLVKKFNFIHNSTTSKALLDTLIEFDRDSSTVTSKKHVFKYNGVIPSGINGLTRKIDYWNYYNASNNTNLLPNISNRTPSLDPTMIGSLKTISYPTGGISEYTYELNDFSYVRGALYTASGDPNKHKETIGGLRVKKITDYVSENSIAVTKEYQYNDWDNTSLSSGIVNEVANPSIFNISVDIQCSNLTSWTGAQWEVLASFAGYGGGLYSTCPPDGVLVYKISKSEPYSSMAVNPVYYYKVSEITNNESKKRVTFTSHFDYPDFLGKAYRLATPSIGEYSSKDFARSLPKSIKEYSNNTLVSETEYTYILKDRYKSSVFYRETIWQTLLLNNPTILRELKD